MKTAALTATFVMAATFLPVPAMADDPGVDMQLSLSRSQLPIVVLEADAHFGSLDVDVSWTVNGLPVDEAPRAMGGERLLDIRHFEVAEAAMVCARMEGRLELHGDAGRDIEESDCVLWLPSDAPPSAADADARLVQASKDRAPSTEPTGLQPRMTRRGF